MQDSNIALSPVLQFRQDLQVTLRAGVRRAIEAVPRRSCSPRSGPMRTNARPVGVGIDTVLSTGR